MNIHTKQRNEPASGACGGVTMSDLQPIKEYHVCCADCGSRYVQRADRQPFCCGVCASRWIAVRLSVNGTDIGEVIRENEPE